jgi:predicted transcriptional regulator
VSVRTTVYLDDELVRRLKRLLPPRRLNRLVNEALAEKVEALERAELEQAMKEGYLATERGRAELSRDWETVDREDWPA